MLSPNVKVTYGAPNAANTGVRACGTIPFSSTAGPYPSDIMLGLNSDDARELHHFFHVRSGNGKIVSEKSEVSLSWMLYVKSARDKHEQNLEAYCDVNGRIFFRSVREISNQEQLFVWYNDRFAMEIEIPPLTPLHIQGNQHYVCDKCSCNFQYPNPLKAHMRFHCVNRHHENPSKIRVSPLSISAVSSPLADFTPSRLHFPLPKHPKSREPFGDVQPIYLSDRTSPGKAVEKKESRQPALSSECQVKNWSSQPIQIFNHIHPPIIPFHLDYHAFKLYHPYFHMPLHETDHCCDRYTSGFNRTMMSYPCAQMPASRSHNQESTHQTPTDLRIQTPSFHSISDTQIHELSSSPLSHSKGESPYPVPSEKAGEPLDLLPAHMYLSKSRKGHLCIYCGKQYSRKYGLKIHLRTHTGYKPLKCRVCLRPFGDPSNLNKHIRLHAEGETPYRCEFCGKVLVRRRDLVRHIKSRHPNEMLRADEIEQNREKK